MLLEGEDDFASTSTPNPPPATAGGAVVHRTVHFRGAPVKLETRWGVGIGGDIWTTASLLCRYLEGHHAFFERAFRGRRILYVHACVYAGLYVYLIDS